MTPTQIAVLCGKLLAVVLEVVKAIAALGNAKMEDVRVELIKRVGITDSGTSELLETIKKELP